MPAANQADQPKPKLTAKERGKLGGNPILKAYKETGVVPDGYYLDDKHRLRKVGEEPPSRLDPSSLNDEAWLTAMRHVAVNGKATDESELEKTARQWKEKQPDVFMKRLWELEAEGKKTAGGATAEEDEVIEPAESDDELAQAIDELIARHQPKGKR